MNPLVYYSSPNPMLEDVPSMDDVHAVHMAIMSAIDCTVYHPSRAFSGVLQDHRPRQIDRAAMASSDVVVAAMLTHSPGVQSDISVAQAIGVPVILYQPGEVSPVLLGPATWGFDQLDPAMEFLKTIKMEDRKARHQPLRYTRTQGATPPVQAHDDDAGFDLAYSGSVPLDVHSMEVVPVSCGIAMEFPPDVWGFLVGRSSSFQRRGLLVNPAIIDPGFRGELMAIVRNIGGVTQTIRPGERVAQIVPLPALAGRMMPVEVSQLSPSQRGTNGFGSSGL
jgi:dUTP pyrophosphatase